jgi:hypothetical protein
LQDVGREMTFGKSGKIDGWARGRHLARILQAWIEELKKDRLHLFTTAPASAAFVLRTLTKRDSYHSGGVLLLALLVLALEPEVELADKTYEQHVRRDRVHLGVLAGVTVGGRVPIESRAWGMVGVVEGAPKHSEQSRHPHHPQRHVVRVFLGEAFSSVAEALEAELLVHEPGEH